MHLKKGDTVVVISGRKEDRGKTGEVTRTFPKEGKAIVAGINNKVRHTKPSMANPQGGRIEREAPLPVAKLMVVCQACNKPSRLKAMFVDNKKFRACKRCGEQIPEKVKD
ncbi:MAG: 50S ribosomal protein L24 [Cyanobacteria bacterium NC_groundwater_1444_Ag_S-0.65um_54_12]|nr:50S ribosomal protein L24 [Cyanobacteria bacterium NC_groundwater_1444_Ag_S-0.65um_54_12]